MAAQLEHLHGRGLVGQVRARLRTQHGDRIDRIDRIGGIDRVHRVDRIHRVHRRALRQRRIDIARIAGVGRGQVPVAVVGARSALAQEILVHATDGAALQCEVAIAGTVHLHQRNAVDGLCASTGNVVDGDLGGAAGITGHVHARACCVVAGQHGVEVQGAAIAGVVAVDRQLRIGRSARCTEEDAAACTQGEVAGVAVAGQRPATALVDDDVGWAEDTAGEVEAVKEAQRAAGGIGNGDVALERGGAGGEVEVGVVAGRDDDAVAPHQSRIILYQQRIRAGYRRQMSAEQNGAAVACFDV